VSFLTGQSVTLSSHYHYLLSCVIPFWAVRHSVLTLSLHPFLCQSSLSSQALSPHTLTISCPVSVLTGQSGTLSSHCHYLLSCVIPHWAVRHSLITLSLSPVLFRFSPGSQALLPHNITISCPVSFLTGQSGTLSSHYHYILSCFIPLLAVRSSYLTLSISHVLCHSSLALRHSFLTLLLSPVLCQSLLGSQALFPHTITIFCPLTFHTGTQALSPHSITISCTVAVLTEQSGTLSSHYHYLLSCVSPHWTVSHSHPTLSLFPVLCQSSLDSQALSPHTVTIFGPVSVLTGQSETLSSHYHYLLSCVSPH
jgi:hypothetical protein